MATDADFDSVKKAAEQGQADAMFILATLYADGRGVPRDLTKAMEWRRKAAEAGHEEARASLRDLGQVY